LIGAGGEFSDFQYLQKLLREITIQDFDHHDGSDKTGKEIHSFLARVLYNRRCKQNPLWNEIITAGFEKKNKDNNNNNNNNNNMDDNNGNGNNNNNNEDGESFLGYVDLYGSNFISKDSVATGFGSYMASPILRQGFRPNMSYDEAKALLEKAMTVLVYRHCRTINKFQIATITKDGPQISAPYVLPTFWEHSRFVNPHMA
jgi:20S proteasome subunit beta 7